MCPLISNRPATKVNKICPFVPLEGTGKTALRNATSVSSPTPQEPFCFTLCRGGLLLSQRSFACTFHNASVHPATRKSPHHLFTSEPAPWRMQDFRVFGCPVFVLDKRLQDGDALPKLHSRCWTGIYVGHSLQHAGNVPLMYNPLTTHCSPQYHVTFDDSFSTVIGSNAILSDATYAHLYESTDWLYKSPFGPS